MGSHYVKSAIRNLACHKLNAMISILGLAVGMAVCLLVASFVNYERGFDKSFPDREQTYRLIRENSDTGARLATFFQAITPALANNFPEVDSFTRFLHRDALIHDFGDSFYQPITLVDSNFFDFFPSEVLAGDPLTALADPSSAVLTEGGAVLLFGTADVIGRTFVVDNDFDFQVGAVIASNPEDSHFVHNFLINIENAPRITGSAQILEHPRIANTYNYLKLVPGSNIQELESKTMEFIRDSIEPQFNYRTLYQPLADIHFTSTLESEEPTLDSVLGIYKPFRDRSDLTIFSAVALLTLIVTAFNFVNLQIVQATQQSQNVGVRRTLGATRGDIAGQYLTESVLMSLAALFLGSTLSQLLTPLFCNLVGIPTDAFSTPDLLLSGSAVLAAICVGLLAGLYPAALIAGQAPTAALRGEVPGSPRQFKIRSFLVILQFSICTGLIISSGIINQQIGFALSKPLGYEPDNVVVIEGLRSTGASQQFQVMQDQLLAENSISEAASSTAIPTGPLGGVLGYAKAGEPSDQTYSIRGLQMSESFVDAMGMELIAGRLLAESYSGDRSQRETVEGEARILSNVLINRAAVQAFGWSDPDEALGKQIYRGAQYFTVVGILEDAHFSSLRSAIEPMFFRLDNTRNYMLIKIREGSTESALQLIDEVWNQHVPDYPIQRSFLAEHYAAAYDRESRTLRLFTSLSLIAIAIACLGLHALAAYMAELRTKEIGIRKIVGASVSRITGLLSWDFSKMVLVANVIAWPTVWWLMQQWLANFAYQADISLFVFLAAGISTFSLALATTLQRSYKAAIANPVEALRFE